MATDRSDDVAYKRLALRGEQTIDELAEFLGVTLEQATDIGETLKARGLAVQTGAQLAAIRWWEMDRVELVLSPPWVQDSVFAEFCRDLDAFTARLRTEAIPVIRPYSHETSLVLLLAAGALTAGGLAVKSLLSSLGQKLGEFAVDIVAKYKTKGIDLVRIEGKGESRKGHGVTFTVEGTDVERVVTAFKHVAERMQKGNSDGKQEHRTKSGRAAVDDSDATDRPCR